MQGTFRLRAYGKEATPKGTVYKEATPKGTECKGSAEAEQRVNIIYNIDGYGH